VPEIFADFLTFLVDVFSHWQSWASGGGFVGAAVVILGLWERVTGRSMGKRMYLSIFLGVFLLGAFFMAWRGQYQELKALQEKMKSPEFEGVVGILGTGTWGPGEQDTLVFAGLTIVNPLGPPSGIWNWQMTIELADSTIIAGEAPLLPTQDIALGDQGFVISLSDYLGKKTTQPIPAGGVVQGWLWSVFRNTSGKRLYDDKATLIVSFSDAATGKKHDIRKRFEDRGIHLPGLLKQ
jgi:hypothetical protein